MAYQQARIAPSILAADFTQLGEAIRVVEETGVDLLHIDVMDGVFVPNITMGPFIVEAVRRVTNLHLDVHLMIVQPERYIKAFADAGADTICIHVEATTHVHHTLQEIQKLGCRTGIALNPHTPEVMVRELLGLVDLVNVMTVNPGFGGQTFLTQMMSKVARLKAMAGDIRREIDIEVDGGINEETAPTAVQAGANILVAGTSVFQHPAGIPSGIHSLRASLASQD